MTKLILALDVRNEDEAMRLAHSVRPDVTYVKVGLELFIAAGPFVVRWLVKEGFKVMLDLKLYDIPETVSRAVAVAGDNGVEFLTIHASGGQKMMDAAFKAARKADLSLLAVTMLTTFDDEEAYIAGYGAIGLDSLIHRMAAFAWEAGIHGIVCSTRDVAKIKRYHPRNGMYFVTPGIRLEDGETHDQVRVATPADAKAAGSDYIVVGRPIRDAPDRKAVVAQILRDLA